MRSARNRQGRFVSTSTPPEQVDEPTKPSKMTDEEFERALREANSKPGVLDVLRAQIRYQLELEIITAEERKKIEARRNQIRVKIIEGANNSIRMLSLVDSDDKSLVNIRFFDGSPVEEAKGVMEITLHRTSSEPEIIIINAENKLIPRGDGNTYNYVHWTKG